ncbi:MAG TPA: archaetidylserine decarboxylase [Oligoflexia bacterium]|nr:archaetidylserine decarboxylase [Oligoflexia bacterium]HMP47367.1 archaetidylserine decarboxylase [Oligoflexia bacterium]
MNLYSILRFVPLHLLSRISGILASVTLPVKLRKPLYTLFGRIYGVRFHEVENKLEDYSRFVDFFTRNLIADARSIENGTSILSPVDGRVLEYGNINNSELIQAKGITYTTHDLISDKQLVNRFEHGSYATFYLAPGDYHHIHSPVTGSLLKRVYIPGALFPVSLGAVKNIPSLYCSNERVISWISATDEDWLVIFVGATNVGSIGLSYEPEFRQQQGKARYQSQFSRKLGGDVLVKEYSDKPIPIYRGERIGTFYLGSTVIIISSRKISWIDSLTSGSRVFYGTRIGDKATV